MKEKHSGPKLTDLVDSFEKDNKFKRESFSKRIIRLRKAKRKTASEVAVEIGMKPSTYSDLEGGSIPRNFLSVLERLASSLGVSPFYLLYGHSPSGEVVIKNAEQIKTLADQIIQNS